MTTSPTPSNELVRHLQSKGFSYVQFDLAQSTVNITAWRRNERKTYSVYRAAGLADAERKLLAQIDEPDDGLGDILG